VFPKKFQGKDGEKKKLKQSPEIHLIRMIDKEETYNISNVTGPK
jgi:hypothetical protein